MSLRCVTGLVEWKLKCGKINVKDLPTTTTTSGTPSDFESSTHPELAETALRVRSNVEQALSSSSLRYHEENRRERDHKPVYTEITLNPSPWADDDCELVERLTLAICRTFRELPPANQSSGRPFEWPNVISIRQPDQPVISQEAHIRLWKSSPEHVSIEKAKLRAALSLWSYTLLEQDHSAFDRAWHYRLLVSRLYYTS